MVHHRGREEIREISGMKMIIGICLTHHLEDLGEQFRQLGPKTMTISGRTRAVSVGAALLASILFSRRERKTAELSTKRESTNKFRRRCKQKSRVASTATRRDHLPKSRFRKPLMLLCPENEN